MRKTTMGEMETATMQSENTSHPLKQLADKGVEVYRATNNWCYACHEADNHPG
jgi:hypothetical protein